MSGSISPEANRDTGRITIKSALTDPNFLMTDNTFFSRPQNSDKLRDWYKVFRFENLNDEAVWTMNYLVLKLSNAIETVTRLRAEGKVDSAKILTEKIKLIGDPQVSMKSELFEVYEAVHGNLDMCIAFLGLRQTQGAKNWIDFIIRTWGKLPVYSK